MKKMNKILALFLALCMALSMMACTSTTDETTAADTTAAEIQTSETTTEAPADALYVAGTYTASARGNNGDITVVMTFSDTAITDVVIDSHFETDGICNPAIERIPAEIVEYQSLGVDTVSGATKTSKGILAAVEDCVLQAGGDVEALKAVEIPVVKGEDEEITTDILVIGAGGAGLSAAWTAAELGKEVVLIEATAVTGGAFAMNTGSMLTPLAEDDSENKMDLAETIDYVLAGTEPYDKPLFVKTLAMAEDTIAKLEAEGLHFYSLTSGLRVDGMRVVSPHENGMGNGGATTTMKFMSQLVADLGVDIRLETIGKTLLTDESGAVIGAVAEKADGSILTIHADDVIVATGGMTAVGPGADEKSEFIRTYAPHLTSPIFWPLSSAGNTGDGFMMCVKAGADIDGEDGFVAAGSLMLNSTGKALKSESLVVNLDGVRFASEYTGRNSGGQYAAALQSSNINAFFEITDSKTVADTVENDIANGYAVKADTLEELAALTGMPADTLIATVERYNELCNGGEDLDYGKDAEYMIPLEAPYYAYFTHVEVRGSSVRLIVNENTQVLKEDGTIIPNLYAVGDACKNTTTLYHSSTFALNSGRLAAEHAAAND